MTVCWEPHTPGPLRAVTACRAGWLDSSGEGTGGCTRPWPELSGASP
jgi:hypothetical protein